MTCSHCNDLIYTRLNGGDVRHLCTVSRIELGSSAEAGCASCQFIIEGTVAAVGSNFECVESGWRMLVGSGS
jgi:hypothetical protein